MQHEDPVTDRQPQSLNAGDDAANAAAGLPNDTTTDPNAVANAGAPYPEHALPGTDLGAPSPSGGEVPDLRHLPLEGVTEGTLSDYTMQELQLRSQPFVGASAEGELFADEVTYSQLNEVRQGIIRGDSVLLLSGETGAGKTTLLKQLTRNSGQRLQFFSVKGGEKYTTHNLLNGILDAWKLNTPEEYEDSAKEMLVALQASLERNMIVVLLLDDADLIPDKELHLLLATIQYINTDELLLRIILSAQPEFEQRLPELLPKGRNLPYAVMQVEPLHASRATPYLQLRLNQAGHFDEFPLSEKQVSAIANDASGYPGRINFLAAESLNHLYSPFDTQALSSQKKPGFLSSLTGSGGKNLRKGLFALLGVGLIAAGIFWTSNPDRQGNQQAGASGNNQATTPDTSASGYSTVETRPVNPAANNASETASASANTASTNTSSSSNDASSTATAVASTESAATSSDAAGNESTLTLANNGEEKPNTNVSGAATNAATTTVATSTGTDADATTNANENTDDLKAAANELSVALGTSTTDTNTAAKTVADPKPGSNEAVQPEQTAANASAGNKTDNNTDSSTSQQPDNAATSNESSATGTNATTPGASNAVGKEAANANATDDKAAKSESGETQPAATTGKQAEDTDAELPAANSAETKASGNATSAAAPSGDSVSSMESPNWVLLQNPELWTIQLSASTDRKDITRFQNRANLESPTSIYSFKREDTTWYALVQGLYESMPDARKAIESMNDAAIKNQPWIRKIGGIQKALKK